MLGCRPIPTKLHDGRFCWIHSVVVGSSYFTPRWRNLVPISYWWYCDENRSIAVYKIQHLKIDRKWFRALYNVPDCNRHSQLVEGCRLPFSGPAKEVAASRSNDGGRFSESNWITAFKNPRRKFAMVSSCCCHVPPTSAVLHVHPVRTTKQFVHACMTRSGVLWTWSMNLQTTENYCAYIINLMRTQISYLCRPAVGYILYTYTWEAKQL
jgi:hypothetical protein